MEGYIAIKISCGTKYGNNGRKRLQKNSQRAYSGYGRKLKGSKGKKQSPPNGLQAWIKKWKEQRYIFSHKKPEPEQENNIPDRHGFSPMEYENPCICRMRQIIFKILEQRNMTCQDLKLVVIDSDFEKDDYDIQLVLSQFGGMLNYLMLVTERPVYYEGFMDAMFEEYGLVVQQVLKTEYRGAYGNLILDFTRYSHVPNDFQPAAGALYLPVYKKAWEICENLDILVPVGYNTLVVEGIVLTAGKGHCIVQEELFENKLDRLDQEFRKG